jgi:hypothetical protein
VLQDVLETCYNVLDDLWKLDEFSYPQKRMTHLMDIIAHAITRYVCSCTADFLVWAGFAKGTLPDLKKFLIHI